MNKGVYVSQKNYTNSRPRRLGFMMCQPAAYVRVSGHMSIFKRTNFLEMKL